MWTSFISFTAKILQHANDKTRHFLVPAVLLAFSMSLARAAELPPVERLRTLIGAPPATITVHEPHLSVGDRRVAIAYFGYPAADVMARLFGKDWHEQGGGPGRSSCAPWTATFPASTSPVS